MFRSSRDPPIPRPARPSDATNSANYLSAQIQQILATVLPEPIVSVLAAISDALYRALFNTTNDPPSYTSTLAPPAILLLVTYLVILLVYKSIRSFVGFLIFSLKWAVIFGVIGVLLAWHFGNGDVNQGAHNLAQQSGLGSASWTDIVRKYSAAQHYAPFLAYLPQAMGAASGAIPAEQGGQGWFSQYMRAPSPQRDQSGPRNGHERQLYSMQSDMHEVLPEELLGRDRRVREYRDLRPSRQKADARADTFEGYEGASFGLKRQRPGSPRAKVESSRTEGGGDSSTDYIAKFSKWIGADFRGSQDQSSSSKKAK